MTLRISTVLFLLVCLACQNRERSVAVSNSSNRINPLIEAEELVSLNPTKGYSIVDFRPKEAYDKGHLPNAISIWHDEIQNEAYPYSGMMPEKEQLESLLSKKGIKDSDTLIIYDQGGSTGATRLWWVLHHYGFDQIRILNGGLKAYLSSKGELSTLISSKPKSNFKFHRGQNRSYIDQKTLEKKLQSKTPIYVIDARTKDEYTGKRQKKGAMIAGSIPQSHHLEWVNTIDIKESKKFLSVPELEKLYAKLIPNKESEIVVYCHSGSRSAHTTFVLTQLLGHKNVYNYDGSWTEWSYFDQLPIKKEAETLIFE